MSNTLTPFLNNNFFNKLGEISEKYYHNGIELEKGAIITVERIEKNRKLYEKYCNKFSAYPDLYIDLITPVNSNFSLYFYQRIFLRACMRFRYLYITACRAFSKTFISILALYLKCMFQPGSKLFICAPSKEQSAKIATEKIKEIWDLFPILKKEIIGEGNFGKDYVTLMFRNGSKLDVVGALDTTRGGRRSGGLIDEVRDHDGETLNEVVLPLMNVSRRTKSGVVNPYEPHQSQFFMSSAGVKSSYAYEKLIECFERQIINPHEYFVWGCDYRIPLMHGLLDKSYINDLRTSSTYNEDSFAREYLGVWTGGSDESWFNYDKMSKYRTIVNPENHSKISDKNTFYLISVDVGRLSCQTVVTVLKVRINSNGFFCNIVNIYVLGTTPENKHFEKQALDLKKIVLNFNPKEVIIDGNGLGVGLLDFMVKPTIDPKDGTVYPSFGSINDEDYMKIQPKDCIKNIYVIKANNSLNSKIHDNCYTQIFSGHVRFLIKEQEIKTRIMSTIKGQKMSFEDRAKRLLPHEMTSRLFEEMANLRLKKVSGTDTNLEQINSRFLKDKFSSLEYGLWRMKEIEDEYQIKKRKRNIKDRKLIFFSGNI